jgi:general secretion pathway protein I
MSKSQRRSRSAGFTLLEVIVALALAGLGLALLLGAASQGLGNTQTADRFLEATRHAQTHLAELGVAIPLKAGEYSGDDGGGFNWRVRVEPPAVHSRTRGQQRGQALALYTIQVTVAWQADSHRREVTLQSKRLGQP